MTVTTARVERDGDGWKVTLFSTESWKVSCRRFPVVKNGSWLAGAGQAYREAMDYAGQYTHRIQVREPV